jgi:tetratricopeptide (TPR) repeat protein
LRLSEPETPPQGSGGGVTRNVLDGRAQIAMQFRDARTVNVVAGGNPGGVPRQVPMPPRYFTDREEVLAAADAALAVAGDQGPHVVVFRGQPGVGKRAAARSWLYRMLDRFPDGHFHADLSVDGWGPDALGLESTRLREFLLAAGFDARSIPDTLPGRRAAFSSWSAGRAVAVMVDGASTVAQVRDLMPGPGPSVVVVTEASRLGLAPASFLDVPLLDGPAARELLLRYVGPDRAAAEPRAVDDLLAVCAGLPVAVCVVGCLLAASASRPIVRLASELGDERRRLARLSQGAEASVQAVFNTAYSRVGARAQACYRVLGLHPGRNDVGIAVLAAALGTGLDVVVDAVEELVDVGLVHELPASMVAAAGASASMVAAEAASASMVAAEAAWEPGSERFQLHPLVRDHARRTGQQQDDDRERGDQVRRILTFYRQRAVVAGSALMPQRGWDTLLEPLQLAGEPAVRGGAPIDVDLQAEPGVREVTGPADGLAWLEVERSNVLAVLQDAFDLLQDDAAVIHLAVMLWPAQERGKHWNDVLTTSGLGVQAARRSGRTPLACLLGIQVGFAHLHLNRLPEAVEAFTEAQRVAEQLGDAPLLGSALEGLGLAHLAIEAGESGSRQEEHRGQARRLLERNLAVALDLGHPRRLAVARLHLAKALTGQDSVALLDQALTGFEGLSVPDRVNAAKARYWLGRRHTLLGHSTAARQYLLEASEAMTEHGARHDAARAREALGDLAVASHDLDEAGSAYRSCLEFFDRNGFTDDRDRVRGKLPAAP